MAKYIDLTKEDLEITSKGTHHIYTFEQGGKKYYFKACDREELLLSLLASEMASSIGIKRLDFKVAYYGEEKGLVSKSYNPYNKEEISIRQILENYHKNVISTHESDFDDEHYLDQTHNLETIWWALDYYYKNRKEKEEIVSSLMEEIVKYFIFQILVGDQDLHYDNIIILDNDKPTLAPYFDFDLCFTIEIHEAGEEYCLEAFPTSQGKNTITTIRSFINASDKSYISLVEEMIHKIPPLELLWDKIEKKHPVIVSQRLKNQTIDAVNESIDFLTKVIQENQNNLSK